MNRGEKVMSLEELSETELETYNMIKEAGEIQIRDMPHKNQGAVGKLMAKKLVVKMRKQGKVSKHGFTSIKMTNFVMTVEYREEIEKARKTELLTTAPLEKGEVK